jgi:hypothetical protein
MTPSPATSTAAGRAPAVPAWAWPVNTDRYDRSEPLSHSELDALRGLGTDLRRRQGEGDTLRWRAIARLLRPLDDARASLRLPAGRRHRRAADDAIALILARCAEAGTTYWGWSAERWLSLAGTTAGQFKRDGPSWADGEVRPYVVAFGYLLAGFDCFSQLGGFNRRELCYKIFGKEVVDDSVRQVAGILAGWGYQVHAGRGGYQLASVLCQLLLHNRSPLLEDLSTDVLSGLRTDPCTPGWQARRLFAIQKAVASLGLCDPPVRTGHPGLAEITGTSAQWARYVQRWYDTSTLTPKVRSLVRTHLAKAGRWLAAEHPDITEPGQWTRQTCASWVAAVDRMRAGDYVQRPEALRSRVGAPLLPATKAHMLMASRTFFRDCQEWEWIPRRFDPARVLTVPRSVRALLGTNPRVIADEVWAKLLWAGLNLTPQDMPANRSALVYPIELIRAVTLTWLFSGLRSDETARLRVGCIRWQHQGSAIPGDSRDVLAEDAVCLLDVPTHKTGTAFTKPVDPLLGQAIEAWQAIRPAQPAAQDRKTGEHVDLLFSIRAHPIARDYINRTIIPALCRKAGVPAADVRGNITSHRARSTIASQLYNAKEPMTLFELQAWMGHGTPNTTQFYAKITPNTLSKAYRDAGYFSRNLRTIEVLIDRDAVTSAVAGEPWQHYDLGHGYCAYTFFEQCPHRMACARCDFYTPKHSSTAQLLEAKQNLQRMLTVIPLTDDERAAVDDGHAALDKLLQRLADVPTPTGTTPREIGIPPSATLLPIIDIHPSKDG